MRNLLLVSNFVQTGRFTETIVHTDNLNDDKDFGDGTRSSSAIADSGEVIRMSINWRGKVLSGCRTALSDWDSGSRKTDCSPQRSANGQSAYICTSSSSCRAIASQISGIPAFIKNDIIFEPGTSNNTFALLDSTGKVISRGSYGNVGKESGQGPISRDAVCRRFSFGSGYARVSPLSAAISTIERVHVFDVSVMKPLLTLTFQAKGDDPFPSFDHALSPDGIRLGILRDTTLEVYRLPELPAQ